MTITRRSFCASLAAGFLSAIRPTGAEQPVTIMDMAGREVHLPALPKRIVLLEAHDLLTMSLLHPDPASLVVGWAAVDRIDSELLERLLVNGHTISVAGKQSPDTVSLEGLIGLAPDLVVTTSFMTPQGNGESIAERLGQFGIPVVFSDASSNTFVGARDSDPVAELKASMKMWGVLLGVSEKADTFVSFYERELAGITARISGTKPITTYLEVQSTLDDCCWAAGRKVWGDLLALAGGQPLPGVTAPWFEKLSLEYLLSTPHDVYIASGGGWASGSRPAIGPGLDPKLGRQGLQRLIDGRPAFGHLPSVRARRVHGIWTGLITNLPLNILFVAQAAKWLHPEQCIDLDPVAILDRINRDFAAFPIEGPLWASI
ncbi:ABC transporter substrate-binding protein [Phyllobacterium phragmitis]|uniref:ABC transporter substrate-binding protein n=1 Tax=Phyllobacterium phragmitis TaxID=2670329 RepID=UPI001FDFE4B7|nr:ABC transporter substrate-binding protein [Phyllobacterium phragmitis]